MTPPPDPHYRHRFPAEIISHAVWLYHVFSLSLRDVELILAERGVVVSYETVRRWCKKFTASFAGRLRRRRPRPGDKWHMDEIFIRIQGVQHYLWRAVDQDGVVLDILIQARRDAQAAKRFFKRLLTGLQYQPRVIVTDTPRTSSPPTLSFTATSVPAAIYLPAPAYREVRSDAFSLCGIMLFRLPLDPLRVVQIMLACSIVNQAIMTWSIRHDIDWRGLKIFLLGGMLGLPLGLWLLLHADHHIYMRVFGGFLMAYAGFMLVRSRTTIRVQHPSLDLVAGALGGITSALAAFPSPPVTIWCSLKGWDKQRQRAVFQPFILIVQTASMIAIGLARNHALCTVRGSG